MEIGHASDSLDEHRELGDRYGFRLIAPDA
jgi:hypothetical protein